MKHKFVFATNNAHKLEEVTAILGNRIELLSLKDIHCHTDIPETADTLEGNALLKAQYIYENYQMDCFADDTGLEVEALNGEPGVSDLPAAGYADAKDHNAGKQWCRLDLGSRWAALHKEIPEVRDYYAGRSCHGGSGRQCIPEASDCPPAPLLAGSKRTASDRCPERLLVPIRSYAGLCYRCNDPDRSG